jgi:hypothetical protein
MDILRHAARRENTSIAFGTFAFQEIKEMLVMQDDM